MSAATRIKVHNEELLTDWMLWSDNLRFATIENTYRELSDPTHPVSIAMAKMRDIPEIRIIEGKTVRYTTN
ncbi:MAG: hypothetical protein C0392_04345 [Syntrophus sp. (in: bacteria)]|nr:hypothetical protein [Syntrophus sp. (in: bacteria)]